MISPVDFALAQLLKEDTNETLMLCSPSLQELMAPNKSLSGSVFVVQDEMEDCSKLLDVSLGELKDVDISLEVKMPRSASSFSSEPALEERSLLLKTSLGELLGGDSSRAEVSSSRARSSGAGFFARAKVECRGARPRPAVRVLSTSSTIAELPLEECSLLLETSLGDLLGGHSSRADVEDFVAQLRPASSSSTIAQLAPEERSLLLETSLGNLLVGDSSAEAGQRVLPLSTSSALAELALEECSVLMDTSLGDLLRRGVSVPFSSCLTVCADATSEVHSPLSRKPFRTTPVQSKLPRPSLASTSNGSSRERRSSATLQEPLKVQAQPSCERLPIRTKHLQERAEELEQRCIAAKEVYDRFCAKLKQSRERNESQRQFQAMREERERKSKARREEAERFHNEHEEWQRQRALKAKRAEEELERKAKARREEREREREEREQRREQERVLKAKLAEEERERKRKRELNTKQGKTERCPIGLEAKVQRRTATTRRALGGIQV